MRCNFAPASAPCRDSYCPGLSITYPVLGTTDERQMAFDLRNHCARSGTRTTFQPFKHWEPAKTCGVRGRRIAVPTSSICSENGSQRPGRRARPGKPGRANWLVAQRPPALTCRKNGSRPLPQRTQELLMCSGLWTFHKFQPRSRASSQLFQPAPYREPEQFDICSSS